MACLNDLMNHVIKIHKDGLMNHRIIGSKRFLQPGPGLKENFIL